MAVRNKISTSIWIVIWHNLWRSWHYSDTRVACKSDKTNSTEECPLWEADSRLAGQEIHRVLWNAKPHFRVHREKSATGRCTEQLFRISNRNFPFTIKYFFSQNKKMN